MKSSSTRGRTSISRPPSPTGWSGTTGSWLALTSDRDYVLSDASSGTHLASFSIMFGDDNVGTNAVEGFGSMKLIVP